ncbi:MAG: hypothetical protein E7638_03200 [Ruminococcaceae bacterium]|nr:hypothetical protein [Oscillospiraceae bacterium]
MIHLPKIKEAWQSFSPEGENAANILRYRSFRQTYGETPLMAKAKALKYVFENYEAQVEEYERVAGSKHGLYLQGVDPIEVKRAERICDSYGTLCFHTNSDHFAPGYDRFLAEGVDGTMARIEASLIKHKDDPEKVEFLTAQKLVLEGFSVYVENYAKEAARMAECSEVPECREELSKLSEALHFVSHNAPVTFRQALNLVMLIHMSFLFQNKYAMALGRLDQYLYRYYRHDIDAGILTEEEAEDMLGCAFMKLKDDIVNIAIGGVTPQGEDGINELSYVILHAVRNCNIPGPNLSARLHGKMEDRFLDECLQVIGTGLGYPALMNDDVNIPALARHGYAIEDARNYCFVGCIENFIQGKQPAWSDNRFNVPHMLEGVFHRGRSTVSEDYLGLDTGDVSEIKSMDDFMGAFEAQIAFSAGEYVTEFNNTNSRLNYRNYADPFMSLFCDDCIDRGMDINAGGATYFSVHGAAAMGIGTVADSLAAIEKVVFIDKYCTLETLRDALAADFKGYEELQVQLKKAPKYGNNDDFVDKYAVWYVKYMDQAFKPFRTRDGGVFYTIMASNTQNISAGSVTGATPDGRHARFAMSDAASPTYGMDKNGPTSSFLSLCKPDYTLVSCGTVVNQKYTSDMLRNPEKRKALTSAIRVYFKQGGQEVQINCVDRDTLKDAMENPENYENLVVRVSGFSGYFTRLNKAVQEDILRRTEHASI